MKPDLDLCFFFFFFFFFFNLVKINFFKKNLDIDVAFLILFYSSRAIF